MESCLELLPRKSYNTFGVVLLSLFVATGVVLIAIATDFESKATLQCNPDKSIASDLATRKYIDTNCLLKYAEEFHPSLPLHILFMVNFGLVIILSIIYAYSVKHRVEIFADPPSATTNNVEEESQPLSAISQAASDPTAHRNSAGRCIVFAIYIFHLILCRVIPLVVFAIWLYNSSHFPVQFHCNWPMLTTTTFHANFTQRQSTNFSIVDCTYPMGKKYESAVAAVITINFLFGSVTLMELAYILWPTMKDRFLLTDFEFCSVYLLRKRKSISKLFKRIKENISNDIFHLHDDFGENHLSCRKLEEIYVNVIIQEGRESTYEEMYEAHLKKQQPVKTTFKSAADLFEHRGASKKCPRTILVVGRPGIGKTLLTKKLLYQWQQQESEFWRDKIVVLIRFRAFNNNKRPISLREMLRNSDGLNLVDLKCIYEYICLFPSNVILVFDGLDELKVNNESLVDENPVNSHNDALLIFKQLVQGELLPGVTVLTTSRPTAEQIYIYLEFDLKVEILGFGEEQIREYVKKFCDNDMQKCSDIWNLIKESPELLGLCYIPVNSYIVCLTLRESIGIDAHIVNAEGQRNVPRTITELYKRAIKILLFRHNSKYKLKNEPIPKDYMIIAKLPKQLQNDLDKLKGIAKDGMKEDQLIFEYESSDEFVAELSDCGLFNKLEDKRQNVFCFLHLTIQEFLAALHVVDDMENIESFLREHIENPRWHLVIQFVAGLIGNKIKELKEKRNRPTRYNIERLFHFQIHFHNYFMRGCLYIYLFSN